MHNSTVPDLGSQFGTWDDGMWILITKTMKATCLICGSKAITSFWLVFMIFSLMPSEVLGLDTLWTPKMRIPPHLSFFTLTRGSEYVKTRVWRVREVCVCMCVWGCVCVCEGECVKAKRCERCRVCMCVTYHCPIMTSVHQLFVRGIFQVCDCLGVLLIQQLIYPRISHLFQRAYVY